MNELQLTGVKQQLFNEDIRLKIDEWLNRYPSNQRQSVLIPSLHILQEANEGWLSESVMKALSIYLDIPEINVFEAATFYSMFDLKRVGKNKINICTNISCQLNGAEDIVDHIKQRLGINLGETTKDGKITLREVECLGACCGAPMLQVNCDYYEYLTTDKVDQILAEIS